MIKNRTSKEGETPSKGPTMHCTKWHGNRQPLKARKTSRQALAVLEVKHNEGAGTGLKGRARFKIWPLVVPET